MHPASAISRPDRKLTLGGRGQNLVVGIFQDQADKHTDLSRLTALHMLLMGGCECILRFLLGDGESMVEFGSRDRARGLAEQIAEALRFADEHEDFLLGVKLAEAHAHLIEHYVRPPRRKNAG